MSILFVLILISALIATAFLIVFIWSVRSGQYDDTYTPSVRMLFNDELLEKMADIGIKYKLLKKEQDFYDISLPRKTPFGLYAIMGTSIFRTVRRILPGPYTIVLEASAEVPRDMRNRHGEIGLRMPDLALCRMLVELLVLEIEVQNSWSS